MKKSRFILFWMIATIGCCSAQAQSTELLKEIIGYVSKVKGLTGKPISVRDSARYQSIIEVEPASYVGNVTRIRPYRWIGDTTPIFIDSLSIKDEGMKAVFSNLFRPHNDSKNRRPVYTNKQQTCIVQIDTIDNETEIKCHYLWNPSSFSFFIKNKAFGLGYININNVPLLVYGNAVNLYFRNEGEVHMSNPYPSRSAIIKERVFYTPKTYLYKNGSAIPVERAPESYIFPND